MQFGALFYHMYWRQTALFAVSTRVGGPKVVCGRFLHVFWPFRDILVYFVHLGAFLAKPRSVWGHPPSANKWVIVGTMPPTGPTDTPASAYFDSWQLGWHKYALAGVPVGPVKVMVPTIAHLFALGGCPQNDRVFTKHAPKCTKYAKIAQNGQKTGKKRPHTTFGPPPPSSRRQGAIWRQ